MEFNQKLDEYMRTLGCLNKELAEAAAISKTAVGRYKNGVRVPKAGSGAFEAVVNGLWSIAREKNVRLTREEIETSLLKTIEGRESVNSALFNERIGSVMAAADITVRELAHGINYDASYTSRILRSERKPAKILKIVGQIADYISSNAVQREKKESICGLMNIDKSTADKRDTFRSELFHYLCAAENKEPEIITNVSPISNYLRKLDDFDLDDYISNMRFDDIDLPPVSPRPLGSEYYTGIERMKQSELDFLKAALLSGLKEDIVLYSDMPIAEMAKDTEFTKKYIFGLAMLIKSGHHLSFIHDVNRPFNELMIGLEGNIPLYMTGRISPYYLKNSESRVFCHLLKVCDSAALSGEAISERHSEGRYFLTSKRDEVQYYKSRAAALLDHALPLMEIYTAEKSKQFAEYMERSFSLTGERKHVCSSLPLFTISEKLLGDMLLRNNVGAEDAERIKKYAAYCKEKQSEVFCREHVTIIVPSCSETEFEQTPHEMTFPELFLNVGLRYTFEDYLEHLSQTKEFASRFECCTLEISESQPFKNINFTIIKGREVCVSKAKSPTIHFVIKHPRMVKAFETYHVPFAQR